MQQQEPISVRDNQFGAQHSQEYQNPNSGVDTALGNQLQGIQVNIERSLGMI